MPSQIQCPNQFKNAHVKIMNSYLLFKTPFNAVTLMAGLLYLPRIFVYHSEK